MSVNGLIKSRPGLQGTGAAKSTKLLNIYLPCAKYLLDGLKQSHSGFKGTTAYSNQYPLTTNGEVECGLDLSC